jgi:hypothetical protein
MMSDAERAAALARFEAAVRGSEGG